MAHYDDNFKIKMIEELCDGKNSADIKREYGVSGSVAITWMRKFIAGTLSYEHASVRDNINYINRLKEKAIDRELSLKKHNVTSDENFSWILVYGEQMTDWAEYASKWLKTIKRSKGIAIAALSRFFKDYISNLSTIPTVQEFVTKGYNAPNFYEILYKDYNNQHNTNNRAIKIVGFIDWILAETYSMDDDLGNKLIIEAFENPLTKFLPKETKQSKRVESNKNVLPYRYIKKLREILCPSQCSNFSDWLFAQTSLKKDWYIVDEDIIDKDDPDCVFKHVKERTYKLWFPGRAVALLIKLLLPLRTYQIRMLDSGEMDTFKYVQQDRLLAGMWQHNDLPLKRGTDQMPYAHGVFRCLKDKTNGIEMTGFYINTNKTADIWKDEYDKGYEIPWQYEEALYWLAKLRDWQAKYNPVSTPTRWVDLSRKHFGQPKSSHILKQLGATTFLFRCPTMPGEEDMPIPEKSLDMLWYRLLKRLEDDISKETEKNGQKKIVLVDPNSDKNTYFPLHSLRVSLITAYALEGGVPMPILSKAIAGHARLIMTLYYTKMGISYVTDVMTKAEKNIIEADKEEFSRFIRDAEYEQLEKAAISNDPAAYQAVIAAQHSGASIIISDKGICPLGCAECSSGGTYTNDDGSSTTYGAVPGYPEKNCVRCRWFITGPAFLPGLVHHFNVIGYNMGEIGKQVDRYRKEIEALENIKYECEISNKVFSQHNSLLNYEQLYEQTIQKNDKLANDYNATLRLIDKCIHIMHSNPSSDNLKLVPVGTISDVKRYIYPTEHTLEQIQVICNGAELFPETDASKAILQRSQIIDLTLQNNGHQPVMFSLPAEEQLKAGNQFMRILIKRAGTLKQAIPYVIGRKKLADIGINNEFYEEIKNISNDEAINLLT